jgi:hypothetical protein
MKMVLFGTTALRQDQILEIDLLGAVLHVSTYNNVYEFEYDTEEKALAVFNIILSAYKGDEE